MARIRVTFSRVLEFIWGAEEAFSEGGSDAVLDLIAEDFNAFMTDPGGTWLVEPITEESAACPE